MRGYAWGGLFGLVLMLTLALSGRADAQPAVGELAKRLSSSPDFRVRTQAALALGASRSAAAVKPLCGALGDSNTTVRAASAAALGRLSKASGKTCLEQRLTNETNADVRSVIQRAIERIAPAVEGILPGTRFYIAIGEPTNKTGRGDAAIDRVVRRALVQQINRLGGFVVAPADETTAEAKELLAKHPTVKPIFVWPKVQTTYSGGALQLEVNLSLFTYPGKAFKGSMKRRLTMPDTPQQDAASEDQLIEMAAERLAPDLETTAARI